LEKVVVLPIHQGDAHWGAFHPLAKFQAPESSPQNHDMRHLFVHEKQAVPGTRKRKSPRVILSRYWKQAAWN
jgi:hypothetical protein